MNHRVFGLGCAGFGSRGTWRETQWLYAPAPIGTMSFGAGPAGPAFHDVWIDPLGRIAGYPMS